MDKYDSAEDKKNKPKQAETVTKNGVTVTKGDI
jgi:hypothetical protein